MKVHHGILAFYLGLFACAMGIFVMVVPLSSQAANFGANGAIAIPVLPDIYNPPVPLCPAHLLIHNNAKNGPTLMGIYFTGTRFFSYLHSLLFVGSNKFFILPYPAGPYAVNFIGKYNDKLPYLTCNTNPLRPVPYPVYPVDGNLIGSYFIGNSLLP